LKGGRVHAELKEVFAILANGAEQELAMVAAGAPKSAIDEDWLPIRNPLRNVLGSGSYPISPKSGGLVLTKITEGHISSRPISTVVDATDLT